MRAVVELLWNLCLLRVGPERMPRAGLFVLAVAGANAVMSILVFVSASLVPDLGTAGALWIIQTAVLSAGVFLVLQIRGHAARFTPTFSAIMGADLVITALQWPVALIVSPASSTRDTATGAQLVLAVLELGLLVWWLTIVGFILARAMDASRIQGVAVAVFLILSSLLVTGSLFPPPGTELAAPTGPTS